jgi:hypothetical protein
MCSEETAYKILFEGNKKETYPFYRVTVGVNGNFLRFPLRTLAPAKVLLAHWIGEWMNPTAGLVTLMETRIFLLLQRIANLLAIPFSVSF